MMSEDLKGRQRDRQETHQWVTVPKPLGSAPMRVSGSNCWASLCQDRVPEGQHGGQTDQCCRGRPWPPGTAGARLWAGLQAGPPGGGKMATHPLAHSAVSTHNLPGAAQTPRLGVSRQESLTLLAPTSHPALGKGCDVGLWAEWDGWPRPVCPWPALGLPAAVQDHWPSLAGLGFI